MSPLATHRLRALSIKQIFDPVDLGWQADVCAQAASWRAWLRWEDSKPQAWSNVLFHQIICLPLPTLLLVSSSLPFFSKAFSKQGAKDMNI